MFVILLEDDWSAASLARIILCSARLGLARHVLCGGHIGLGTGQAVRTNCWEKGEMIDKCVSYFISVISEL